MDVIRVTDTLTNEYALSVIRVEADAAILPSSRQVVLPVGSRIQSPFGGGSGIYTLESTSDAITISGNSLFASKAGSTTLTATRSSTVSS